jgi:hypothetical protein
VLGHVHEREDASGDPRQPPSLAALPQGDRGYGAAVLPEHRGQDRAVRGQGSAPDLSRARGRRGRARPGRRGLSERHLDLAALRCPARVPAHDPRARAL